MADYSRLPANATLKPVAFKAHIEQDKIQRMKDILQISPIGPAVFENTAKDQGPAPLSRPDRRYGMRRDYLIAAKERWLDGFDWRKVEDEINSFPNFSVPITGDDGVEINVHFLALFSEKQDAVPLAFYHGWPGSFLEFLKIAALLKQRYKPSELPYHVIVPSLPGYAFSSGPPVDVDYQLENASDVMNKLMIGLGFSFYVAQGGDLGSFVARHQARHYPQCKSMHINLLNVGPFDPAEHPLTATEKAGLTRAQAFGDQGWAYGVEHGTRTATIGLALSASPLALFSWIGEKFLEWSDDDPTLDEILASVSLYWLTDTFPRCIYPYRGIQTGRPPMPKEEKPSGYSYFPKEIRPTPESWARQVANIVAFKAHDKGGHFAALEQPEALLADVEEWIKKVW